MHVFFRGVMGAVLSFNVLVSQGKFLSCTPLKELLRLDLHQTMIYGVFSTPEIANFVPAIADFHAKIIIFCAFSTGFQQYIIIFANFHT